MKRVNIKSIIINSENDIISHETKGFYDEKHRTINFKEEDLEVQVKFSDKEVKINRANEEYMLDLKFKLNKKTTSIYEIRSFDFVIELTVVTKQISIEEKIIFIEYELYDKEEIIGIFEYKLMFWEEK